MSTGHKLPGTTERMFPIIFSGLYHSPQTEGFGIPTAPIVKYIRIDDKLRCGGFPDVLEVHGDLYGAKPVIFNADLGWSYPRPLIVLHQSQLALQASALFAR